MRYVIHLHVIAMYVHHLSDYVGLTGLLGRSIVIGPTDLFGRSKLVLGAPVTTTGSESLHVISGKLEEKCR